MMTTETLDARGWRIPFLLGLVVGVVGFVLRRHFTEAAPLERGSGDELAPACLIMAAAAVSFAAAL